MTTPQARWCGYCQRSIAECSCPPWMPNTGTEDERKARGDRQESERRIFDNSSMIAQTNAQRQEALRAKRAMLGMTEVRGIYLPPEMHQRLKEEADRLLKATNRAAASKGS